MQPIHSRTTTERIVRTALLTVLLCGFSAWLLWDGYVAYPRENIVSVFTNKLGIEPPDPLPVIHHRLTAETAEQIADGEPLEHVESRLAGEPFRFADDLYYFGSAGHLRVGAKAGRVTAHQWVPGPEHTASDLVGQKLFGFGLAPIGLAFVIQLIRVLLTRVSLTDEGLRIGRKPLIPLDSVTAILADKYKKTGCVDLQYSDAGRPRTRRLDNYVIKEFRGIVTAICEAKGLPNPLQAGSPSTPQSDTATPG